MQLGVCFHYSWEFAYSYKIITRIVLGLRKNAWYNYSIVAGCSLAKDNDV